MKKRLILVAILAASASFADARIDVNGQKDGIVMKPGTSSTNARVYTPKWTNDAVKMSQSISSNQKINSNDWEVMEISFTPEKDGEVSIQFAGEYAKDPEKRLFYIFDDIEINGKVVRNGSFEELNDQNKVRLWWMGKNAEVSSDAKSGKTAVKVNHDNRVGRNIRVKANVTYTIKANVKKATK